jgi:hypothetical protein
LSAKADFETRNADSLSAGGDFVTGRSDRLSAGTEWVAAGPDPVSAGTNYLSARRDYFKMSVRAAKVELAGEFRFPIPNPCQAHFREDHDGYGIPEFRR